MVVVRKACYAVTVDYSGHKDFDYVVVADLVRFGHMVGSGIAMALKMTGEIEWADET